MAEKAPSLPQATRIATTRPVYPAVPTPTPPAPTDRWAPLWALALQIAAHRQRGLPGPQAADGPLRWSPAGGWQLQGEHDAFCAEHFALYKPLLDRGPAGGAWVVAQLGQSLDGCIATANGDSCFVTGAESIDHLHRLRALCDAVVVGAGTVAADNPRLTTRRVPGRNPTRVVLDPRLRAPANARLLHDGEAPTLWLCDASCQAQAAELSVRAEVLAVPGLLRADGTPDAHAAVAALHARGLHLLFVEGGGATVTGFLRQGALNRLHLTVAPVFIGSGRRGLALPGFATMGECLRPPCRVMRLGHDVLWDLAFAASAG